MHTHDSVAQDATRHPKVHNIVVNGKARQFAGPVITYDEVVRLAYPEGPFDIIYTVAYVNPEDHAYLTDPEHQDRLEGIARKFAALKRPECGLEKR